MAERNVGIPWTTHEDYLLTQAVAQYGESDNWKIIASCIPGRTNKACRKRWLHSLSPSVKKTAWTAEEDSKLIELYSVYHTKWAQIAREIPGRTDDACSKRYREALDPSLKKDEWTSKEDQQLAELHEEFGGRWGHIGQILQRSGLGCRNRWRLLMRKKTQPAPETPPPSTAQVTPQGSEEWAAQPNWVDTETVLCHSPYLGTPQQPEATLSPQSYEWPAYEFESNASASYFTPQFSSPPAVSTIISIPTQQEASIPISFPPAEGLAVHNFHPPPFKFSSSSLSAALSDPLPSKPLPPVNSNSPNNSPNLMQRPATEPLESNSRDHVPPQSSFYDQPPSAGVNGAEIQAEYHSTGGGCPTDSLLFSPSQATLTAPTHITSTNGIIISQELSNGQRGYEDSPEGFSVSGLSTPLGFAALSLSPSSSPSAPASPIELPSMIPAKSGSVLYSPYHRSVPDLNTRRPSRRRSGHPRLDSALPITSDRSVRPYACGYEQCWPPDETMSRSCFATSKELSDHSKDVHGDVPACDKPYRCGLDGCAKSWRSINGLQYHLQISKSHFQHALSSRFAPEPKESRQHILTFDNGTHDSKKRRTYPCPRPHCFNEYRQLGGLRYHLKHGHPEDMPAQLEVVPPSLVRKVEERLRAKAPE